jgi:hypothetical protein
LNGAWPGHAHAVGVFSYGLAVIQREWSFEVFRSKSMPSKRQPSTVVAMIALSVALLAVVGQRPEIDKERRRGRFRTENRSVDCHRLLQMEHMLWPKQPPRTCAWFSREVGACEMLNEFWAILTDLNPLPFQCPTWSGSRRAPTCRILLEQSWHKSSAALMFACTCD